MKLDWKQVIVSLVIGVFLGSTFSCWKCKECCPCPFEGGSKKERMLNKFSKKLDLNEEQKTQVSTIFEDKFKKMEELHNAKRDEIRAVLTPDQQSKFDQITAKWETRKKRW